MRYGISFEYIYLYIFNKIYEYLFIHLLQIHSNDMPVFMCWDTIHKYILQNNVNWPILVLCYAAKVHLCAYLNTF